MTFAFLATRLCILYRYYHHTAVIFLEANKLIGVELSQVDDVDRTRMIRKVAEIMMMMINTASPSDHIACNVAND